MRRLVILVLGQWVCANAALANNPATAVPVIPEPAALALFVLGAGVMGVAIRRRKD